MDCDEAKGQDSEAAGVDSRAVDLLATHEAARSQHRPSPATPTLELLIPRDSTHPGAGAAVIRNAVPDDFLEKLDALRLSLPLNSKRPTAKRRFFRDEEGWVAQGLLDVLTRCGVATEGDELMPWFRVLEYDEGGHMAPHTDGSNTHPDTGNKSTATLLLYLSTCKEGGETSLLESQKPGAEVLAAVKPERGLLLAFPHKCPHVGCRVGDEPKIALRGELIQNKQAADV